MNCVGVYFGSSNRHRHNPSHRCQGIPSPTVEDFIDWRIPSTNETELYNFWLQEGVSISAMPFGFITRLVQFLHQSWRPYHCSISYLQLLRFFKMFEAVNGKVSTYVFCPRRIGTIDTATRNYQSDVTNSEVDLQMYGPGWMDKPVIWAFFCGTGQMSNFTIRWTSQCLISLSLSFSIAIANLPQRPRCSFGRRLERRPEEVVAGDGDGEGEGGSGGLVLFEFFPVDIVLPILLREID